MPTTSTGIQSGCKTGSISSLWRLRGPRLQPREAAVRFSRYGCERQLCNCVLRYSCEKPLWVLRVSPGRVEGALRRHTNTHLHFMFFGTAARSRCEFFEYHPAGSREPSSASHIYLRFMFPNFRTSLPLRVVNHRCDDSPLVFSAQRCNAPVPVTTGQQDKGTRDALL